MVVVSGVVVVDVVVDVEVVGRFGNVNVLTFIIGATLFSGSLCGGLWFVYLAVV